MPISAPTLTSEMFETQASRSPAMTAGSAIGSSIANSRRVWRKPIAVAASITSGGTARSPSTRLRTRITSE